MSPEQSVPKLTGRRDHWLPQCYMQGFIGPSRKDEPRPLYCFEKETQQWRAVSTKEIGQGEGFYDYAEGTDYDAITHPDSVFGRLEKQWRSKRELMGRDKFASWARHKDLLIEFMHMLRARSPMAMEQQRAQALISGGDDNGNFSTPHESKSHRSQGGYDDAVSDARARCQEHGHRSNAG